MASGRAMFEKEATVGTLGYICVSLTIALVVFIAWATWSQLAKEKTIRAEGEAVLCWIVMANDKLYQRNDSNGSSYAVVVFTFDKRLDSDRLQQIAMELPQFEQVDMDSRDERIIASVMRTQIPYFRPLRLPDRITGRSEVYTASLHVYWKLLPQRRLTLPYIWALVLVGDAGGALMIEYPESDPGHAQYESLDDEDD